MTRITDALDCCKAPRLAVARVLAERSRFAAWIETCRCGATWLHAWDEISMSWDSDVETDVYARVSPEEAAALPGDATRDHLAALPERRILERMGDRDAAWRTGRIG
jgi:hypothetical protein